MRNLWQARSLGVFDLEDALQAVSAQAGVAHWLITRDSAGFRSSPVPAISLSEFLARFPLPVP